jgi:glycosyltransferase involved in cell wall biosynthesis
VNHHLYLDIQAVQSRDHAERGIGRYVREHALHLMDRDRMLCKLALNPLLPFPRNLHPRLLASDRLGWGTLSEFRRAQQVKPTIYFMMSPFEWTGNLGLMPCYVAESRVPLVVTLYDLIPLVFAEKYLQGENGIKYLTRLQTIKSADLFLAISAHTRQDAIDHLGLNPEKVAVIGAGVSGYFQPSPNKTSSLKLVHDCLPAINRRIVLTVLGQDDRKNMKGLIEAFGLFPLSLRKANQLVIGGHFTDSYRTDLLSFSKKLGMSSDEVIFPGLIDDELLRSLYQCADLFVFPSFYEGFGLPVAEAVSCGCPAITSDVSSIPEILDWPESTFNPHDPGEIATLMERGLCDEEFRTRLIQRGEERKEVHTWENVAEGTIHALEMFEHEWSTSRKRSRKLRYRIALVGPFPPQDTGIAVFNYRAAKELAKLCDLTVSYVGDADVGTLKDLGLKSSYPARAFGRGINPYDFDTTIYSFGGSPHHFYTYDLMLKYPGMVWLHDPWLMHFYYALAMSQGKNEESADFLREKLDALYSFRVPSRVKHHPLHLQEWLSSAIGMTREVVRNCTGIIVLSDYARQLLRLDQEPGAPMPPVWVLPHAVPEPPAARVSKQQDQFVIGAFGRVSPVKSPEVLFRALHILRLEWNLPAELAFVGPIESSFERELKGKAKREQVDPYVTFIGMVSEQEYWDWLRRVDCAVNLRRSLSHWASGAVCDALAVGLPAVTDMLACKEMPAGVVDMVSPDASAQEIADRLRAIATDEQFRVGLTDAARAYAVTWSYRHMAEELIQIVTERPQECTDSLSAVGRLGSPDV